MAVTIGGCCISHYADSSYLYGAERRKAFLNKRMFELEEACRSKEAERVDLELRLTEVKENLKKSQAGSALGASNEAKPPVKVQLLHPVKIHYFVSVHLKRYFHFSADVWQKYPEHLQ